MANNEFKRIIRPLNEEKIEQEIRAQLKISPDNLELKGKLISSLRKQRKFEAAEELARKLLKENPNNITIKEKLVTVLTDSFKLEEAEALVYECLKENDCIKSRGKLITILTRQGRLEEAETLVREAITNEPNNLVSVGQLISVLIKSQKIKEAEYLTKSYLLKDPDNRLLKLYMFGIKNAKESSKTEKTIQTRPSKSTIIKEIELRLKNGENPFDIIKDEHFSNTTYFSVAQMQFILVEAFYKTKNLAIANIVINSAIKNSLISDKDKKIFRKFAEIINTKKFLGNTDEQIYNTFNTLEPKE